jgi:DNA-binding transcriptional ArsR family regulator
MGSLVGDPTRAEMLGALLDGRAHTVGELARVARVATSTASEHLGRLLDGAIVAVEPQGRHRYYRLAGPDVAAVLEAILELGAGGATSVPPVRAPAALTFARTCYDHLAGTLGVAIHDRLAAAGGLGPVVTPEGEAVLAGFGVRLDAVPAGTRPLVRTCLDWTERRHHLGGALGAALLDALVGRGWLVRRGPPRVLAVTGPGRTALGDPGLLGPEVFGGPGPGAG